MKLDSKLARREGRIPILQGFRGSCKIAELCCFLAGDGDYHAKATKAQMDEYWNFVATLATQEGNRLIVFSDYVRPPKFLKFNNICASNFYEYLRRRHRVYGRVTHRTCIKPDGAFDHKVRVYTWAPSRRLLFQRVNGTVTMNGNTEDLNRDCLMETMSDVLYAVNGSWRRMEGPNDFSLEVE